MSAEDKQLVEEWQRVGERHRKEVERSQKQQRLWMLVLTVLVLGTITYVNFSYRQSVRRQAIISQKLAKQITENKRLIQIIEARDRTQQARDEALKASIDLIREELNRKR